MAVTPLINGRRFSFSSIEIAATIAGNPAELFIDVSAISYSERLEIAMRRGTSRGPIGWTSGTYEAGDATIEMGKSTAHELVTKIGPGWLGINLGIVVAYNDIGELPCFDALVARIIGLDDNHTSGPDALVTSVVLKPFTILRNGIPPLLNRVF